MPTRDQIRAQLRKDFPGEIRDPTQASALQALEELNQTTADLDDELAGLAERLSWLARVPLWVNQRKPGLFAPFVDRTLIQCEWGLHLIRQRWERHQQEPQEPKEEARGVS